MSFGSGSQPSYGSTNPRYEGGSSNEMQPPVVFSGQANASDFYNLCDNVSSNIFSVNNSATTLEKALKQIGTANDSISLRDRIHDTQQTTNRSIAGTTKSFHTLAALVRNGDRQQKLHLDRIRNEFQQTVKRYSNLQKRVAEIIKMHYLTEKTTTSEKSSGWADDSQQHDDEEQLLAQEQKTAQMQAMQQDVGFDTAIIAERESRIRQIEADILDVNQIFRDLGTMVHEQGEMINSIEGNIEKASHEVAGGRDQLHKASQYQKSYRKKLCILLVILLIVIAIVLIIIFTSVKSKK